MSGADVTAIRTWQGAKATIHVDAAPGLLKDLGGKRAARAVVVIVGQDSRGRVEIVGCRSDAQRAVQEADRLVRPAIGAWHQAWKWARAVPVTESASA